MTPPSSSASETGIEYRPDIDGLRAVAVLAVVGFHVLYSDSGHITPPAAMLVARLFNLD